MSNPNTDNSGEDLDAVDGSHIISAQQFNRAQETARHILWGSSFDVDADPVYPSSYVRTKDGFDYDKGFIKCLGGTFVVHTNEGNAAAQAALFQQHCLTDRGSLRHIIVDSDCDLGNCNDLINSHTLIEGATFDYTGNTYKEMDLCGVASDDVTITLVAGSVYNLDFSLATAINLDTKKINIGDPVMHWTGAAVVWGYVYDRVDANNVEVYFYDAPGTGASEEVAIFKQDITFRRCKFYNQPHIRNTINVKFIDCEFHHDNSTQWGAIISDVGYLGWLTNAGTNRLGWTLHPLIRNCVFMTKGADITAQSNAAAPKAVISLDRAVGARIDGNVFHHLRSTALANTNYPISANPASATFLLTAASRWAQVGGNGEANHVRNWAATVASIRTQAARTVLLFTDLNTWDNAAL